MEDKIREAVKALQDKATSESAVEIAKNKAEIEKIALQAYNDAKKEEETRIANEVYAKYQPAIEVLSQFISD